MDKKLSIISFMIIFTHCCDNQNFIPFKYTNNQKTSLEMTTKAFTTESPLFKETFTEGAEIGLFISDCNLNSLSKGPLPYENVKSKATLLSDGNIKWIQSPEIFLESNRYILIFAYYPYQEQNHMNPTSIPIFISPTAKETPDYKYGKLSQGQKEVNNLSPIAKLSMKYALSLLSFELYIDYGINDKFKLTSIQVGNLAGRNTLRFRGTMNIMTGVVTGMPSSYGATQLTLEKAVILHHTYAEEHAILIIPTNASIKNKTIEFIFSINGKNYTYMPPEGTYWTKGNKYRYRFLFTGNEIKLIEATTSVRVPPPIKRIK